MQFKFGRKLPNITITCLTSVLMITWWCKRCLDHTVTESLTHDTVIRLAGTIAAYDVMFCKPFLTVSFEVTSMYVQSACIHESCVQTQVIVTRSAGTVSAVRICPMVGKGNF
jgi:hypothetical protein